MTDVDLPEHKLTDQQIEAIKCKLGPVMVIAGAGSGKTSVIAHRFLYLNSKLGIDCKRILCVTFTNKAVKNLKERIRDYWPTNREYNENNIKILTFHRLCKEILIDVHEKRNGYFGKKFLHTSKSVLIVREILKDYERINAAYLVTRILEKLRWLCKSQNREFTQDDLLEIGIKNTDITDGEKFLQKFPFEDIRSIYHKFDSELNRLGRMTLDDIVLDANQYLMESEVVDEWCAKFDAILCDEFQDVDEIQFNILTRLCKDDHNLFCVGDPDQAIYGFRGSVPKVFIKLREHFHNLGITVMIKKLEKNFRSTPQILDVANNLINRNTIQNDLRKGLFTDNPDGEIPTIDVLETPQKQAEQVVKRIKELEDSGAKLSEIIVLGRNKSHYRYIKNAFLSYSIHFEDWKEVFSLINYMEIKDLIAWISVGFIKDDTEMWGDFLNRVYAKPSVGVGPITFQKLMKNGITNIIHQMKLERKNNNKVDNLYRKIIRIQEIAKDKNLSIHEKCWRITYESGIWDYYYSQKQDKKLDRADTIKRFLDSPMMVEATSWEEALSHFEKYLKMSHTARLVCSTIHGVKGLEFNHVFLVSLSNGKLPSNRGLKICKTEEQKSEYIDEERRVMYVACTRAKKSLHLFTDKPQDNWSPFINDIIPVIRPGIIYYNSVNANMVEEDEEEDDSRFDLMDE